MIKKPPEKYNTLKILRYILLWLLFFVTILILQDYKSISVFALTCPNLKFPLTFGFISGETEIISIDQDSSTENIYIA